MHSAAKVSSPPSLTGSRDRPLPDIHLIIKLCTVVYQRSNSCFVKQLIDRLSELQATLPVIALVDIITAIQLIRALTNSVAAAAR
jgi:hypothetical protein